VVALATRRENDERPAHPGGTKMSIDHVLAVDPISDVEAANARHERLVGRPSDNRPMEDRLIEWRVTETGWVQVTLDADRAGSAVK
jgi:glyoxylase I family protein